MKKLVIVFLALLLILIFLALCAVFVIKMGKPEDIHSQASRKLGFSLPKEASIQFYREESGLNSEMTLIRAGMIDSEWRELLSKRPFQGKPKNETTNPFATISISYDGWHPQEYKKGYGGIVAVDDRRILTYFFVKGRDGIMNCFFLVGYE